MSGSARSILTREPAHRHRRAHRCAAPRRATTRLPRGAPRRPDRVRGHACRADPGTAVPGAAGRRAPDERHRLDPPHRADRPPCRQAREEMARQATKASGWQTSSSRRRQTFTVWNWPRPTCGTSRCSRDCEPPTEPHRRCDPDPDVAQPMSKTAVGCGAPAGGREQRLRIGGWFGRSFKTEASRAASVVAAAVVEVSRGERPMGGRIRGGRGGRPRGPQAPPARGGRRGS